MTECTKHGFSYLALLAGVLEVLSPGRWGSSSIKVEMRPESTGMSVLTGKKTILWKEVQKNPILGSSFLAAPSMQMHWLVPHMETENECELSSLAEGCQVLAFQSCSLLWLIAAAGGLLLGEAKTDR